MILSEYVDNETRIRHYSDQYLKIRQVETGVVYDDAVDYLPCRYTYEETDIPIEDEEATPEEALNILLGGAYDEEV